MRNNNLAKFGRLLRARREAAGKTLAAVAETLGLSVSYIADIERGYRAPLAPMFLERAAKFLGADLGTLASAAMHWHGEAPIPLTGDEMRDSLAVALALRWVQLDERQIEAIAAAAGIVAEDDSHADAH